MRYIGVKVSTFKISFKMTEELININPMFKPIVMRANFYRVY
jgi:hypothetical protein